MIVVDMGHISFSSAYTFCMEQHIAAGESAERGFQLTQCS